MVTIISIIAGSLMAFISALHFYWALGGTWWLKAAVPEWDGKLVFSVSPIGIFGVGFGLLIASLIMFGSAGVLVRAEPPMLFYWGRWVLVLIFTLRTIGDLRFVGIFKKVRTTEFSYWDSRIYTPLSTFLAASCFLAAYQ